MLLRMGVIQDATFIGADQGEKRKQEKKKAKREGRGIKYTKKQKAIWTGGTYAVKGNNIHYGCKDHIKGDIERGLIRSIETRMAGQHNSTVELIEKGYGVAYSDRGCSTSSKSY